MMKMTFEIYRKINELLKNREKFAVATIIRSKGSSPRDKGAKMIIRENGKTIGTIGGDRLEEKIKKMSLAALQENETRTVEMKLEEDKMDMKCGGEVEVYIEIPKPASKLLIIGSGKIASALAEFGTKIRFEVTIVDPFLQKKDLPSPVNAVKKPIEEGIGEIATDSQTYIVVTTRHKYDKEALLASLRTEAPYIGLVGSKNRVKSIFNSLNDKEVKKEELKRINAPVGLDIGAETPEEIAISILSEIIREKRDENATGESLRINA